MKSSAFVIAVFVASCTLIPSFCYLFSQFLTQKEFRDIRLQQIAAQLEPTKGKKRQLQELMVTQAEDSLPQK